MTASGEKVHSRISWTNIIAFRCWPKCAICWQEINFNKLQTTEEQKRRQKSNASTWSVQCIQHAISACCSLSRHESLRPFFALPWPPCFAIYEHVPGDVGSGSKGFVWAIWCTMSKISAKEHAQRDQSGQVLTFNFICKEANKLENISCLLFFFCCCCFTRTLYQFPHVASLHLDLFNAPAHILTSGSLSDGIYYILAHSQININTGTSLVHFYLSLSMLFHAAFICRIGSSC